MAVGSLRPTSLEIVDERFPYNWGQRISRCVSCLAFQNLKPFALPVNIIQRKPRHLMRTQSVGHQKKQNRVVPTSPDRSSFYDVQHTANFVPGYGTRHIVQTIYL